ALSVIPSGTLSLRADGGGGGAPGTPGQPGGAGAKGTGGNNYAWRGSTCERECVKIGRAPDGGPGALGAGPEKKAVAGDPGARPGDAVQVVARSDADAGQTWDVQQFAMLAHRIELWYLNGQYADAATRIVWLERMTRVYDGPQQGASQQRDLHRHAVALSRQIRSSLDFFGLPSTYVPLATLATYDGILASNLATGVRIEESYRRYIRAGGDATLQLQAATDGIAAADSALKELQNRLDATLAERATYEAQIIQLRDEMIPLSREIGDKHAQFVSDVQKKLNPGCGFPDALNALGTIVAAAGTFGAAGVAIAGAVEILKPGSHNDPKGRFTALKSIGGSVKEIGAAYGSLRDEFQPKRFDDLDFQKFSVEQKKYDDLLDQYRDLASANELRDLVDRYFMLNQARNERLLSYSASFTTENRLISEISLKKQQRDHLQASLNGPEAQLALATEAKTFVGSLYEQAKYEAVRLLWYKRKALEYETLSEIPQEVNDLDFAVLSQMSAHLDALRQAARDEGTKSDFRYQPFTVAIQVLLVTSDAAYKKLGSKYVNTPYIAIGEAFNAFTASSVGRERPTGSGTLPFVISTKSSVFDYGWSSIRLDGVQARLLGVESWNGYQSDIISLDIVHGGVSVMLDPLNHKHVYVHRPVHAPVTYNLGQGFGESSNNIVGDIRDTYVGVSPFATWKLVVRPHNSVLPRLSKVNAVLLRFYGRFQGLDGGANPQTVAQLKLKGRATMFNNVLFEREPHAPRCP
ncbi:MAG: hypothetical protein QOI11_1289, partial [Candidatus Eremiobacteraeota bacterium]|nr:hypothetical protein [Candidatus Eremiobacteraeota bacterium]